MGSEVGLEDAENLAHTGIRSSDRAARSQSLYRLSYPAPPSGYYGEEKNVPARAWNYTEVPLDVYRFRPNTCFQLRPTRRTQTGLTFRRLTSTTVDVPHR